MLGDMFNKFFSITNMHLWRLQNNNFWMEHGVLNLNVQKHKYHEYGFIAAPL